ncbi:MAG: universal stress protein [Gemmatimonadaceae bacterium]
MTYPAATDVGSHARIIPADTGVVLVAMKPDGDGDAALAMGQWLAEHERSELRIVSVMETTPIISASAAGAPALPPFVDDDEREHVIRRLREIIGDNGHNSRASRIDLRQGSPAATITRFAREHGAGLIVIGTGSHGRIGHLIYGERVAEIVGNSETPVLIVPPDAASPIERAMVAVDFSLASERAAASAHRMLGRGGRLTLVHVKRAPGADAGGAGKWDESFGPRTSAALARFARTLGKTPGVRVDVDVLHGEPTEVLTTYALEHGMQLLACGVRHHGVLEQVLSRSVTTGLIRGAHCAVLVAPAPRVDDDAA